MRDRSSLGAILLVVTGLGLAATGAGVAGISASLATFREALPLRSATASAWLR